jgi:hypothetical protein
MKKVTFILLAFVLILASCDPDSGTEVTTTDLTMNFKGKVGDENLVFFQYYPTENGDSVFLNVVHFFVSDIRLVKGSEETQIEEITVLDFKNNHSTNSDQGESFTISDIEAGNYTGIKFGIGVDSVLNKTIPADYAPSEPLANASEYWEWRETYIFGKFEGRLKESDGTQTGYAYHPGSNELFRNLSFQKAINLEAGIPANVDFTIDFGEIFKQGNGYIDIKNNNISHTGQDDFWLVSLLMDNLAGAIE